jgi:hypothetical protein
VEGPCKVLHANILSVRVYDFEASFCCFLLMVVRVSGGGCEEEEEEMGNAVIRFFCYLVQTRAEFWAFYWVFW